MRAIAAKQAWSWPRFALLLVVELWLAHAVAFFAHEYAHSLVAWLLGWKANPLALDYAHPSWKVFLIQLGINQNVNEVPVFASGHGVQAGLISLAGAMLGNGLVSLPLSRWRYAAAIRDNRPAGAMFWYWVTVASVGNLIDYVPVRTFTAGTDLYQDMFAVEKGFGWSPWLLLVVLGIPTAWVLAHFLLRTEPRTLRWLFPQAASKRVVMAVVTAYALFGFYGAAGWSDVGPVAHRMSVISACVVAPALMLLTAFLQLAG